MTEYTDDERKTIRTAAFGALFLVSQAEPGFMDMFRESVAGSKALAETSPELRDLLKSGGMPPVPKGSPAEVEAGVLSALQRSTQIFQAKAPGELDGFRTAVITACDRAAAAADGTHERETAAVGKVRAALGVS